MLEYTKSEILNELSKLYILKAEGKKVNVLIAEYEKLLYRLTDEELDSKEVDEEN